MSVANGVNDWLKRAVQSELLTEAGLNESALGGAADLLFPQSLQRVGQAALAMVRMQNSPALAVIGDNNAGFRGTEGQGAPCAILFCPPDHYNAEILRKVLPFTAPSPLGDQDVTFGVGDRLGVASPGHIRLFKKYRAAPVLAQQSARELDLTDRSYKDVLDSASWAVFQEGYTSPWGADGDHLKSEDWVKSALEIGNTMITADVSDYIKGEYQDKEKQSMMQDYTGLSSEYRQGIEERFLGLKVELDTGNTISFSREELARTALIYGQALEHALRLYRVCVEVKGEGNFDFELSIDETATPTTPEAHIFIAEEAKLVGIKSSSIAPRFVGEFQKGIDYIGSAADFESSFAIHAAIAERYGYRISVHSGSDKFTVFPVVGKHTSGRFHVKTAGTNWLEAVKVLARHEPALFRELYAYALTVFEKARKYYHITPNLDNLPVLATLSDDDLVTLFTNDDARQVIHITYGEIFKNASLKERFFAALNANIEEYWLALEKHIGRHLELLGVAHENTYQSNPA